jgi:hypothetical protein
VDRRSAHRNLVDSSRQLFELDPGAAVEAGQGWLLGAGTSTHPVISNAAFRSDDAADAAELIARARDFFGARERGFSVWVRGEQAEDRDLVAAAESHGLTLVYEMPEMVLGRRAEQRSLPPGAELRTVRSAEDAEAYWRVAVPAYASLGFPPETLASYTNHEGLWADNVVAILALLDGEPVSVAMTIVSHGVAGIYWVGTLERARGRGLAWAATAAATNAGFDLGAEMASLQASPMGEPIYSAMGYERIFDYRLLMSPSP